MSKRKLFILFTVVIAIAALFAASEVMAFCTNCDPPNAPYEVEVGAWTVKFLGITPVYTDHTNEDQNKWTDGCDGVPPGGGTPIHFKTCYRWNYQIFRTGSTSISGLNMFAMLIPDCCTYPYVYVDNETTETPEESLPTNLKIFAVAQGESSVDYGEYNESGYVIQGTPDSATDISILSNTNVAASIPAVLKVKKEGVLSFEIPGPGCKGALTEGATVSTKCVKVATVNAGDVWMNVPRKPDGCDVYEEQVKFYIGSQCSGTYLTPQSSAAIDDFVSCGGIVSACDECVTVLRNDAGKTCIEYTLVTGSRLQQCINSDGTACGWDYNCKCLFEYCEE